MSKMVIYETMNRRFFWGRDGKFYCNKQEPIMANPTLEKIEVMQAFLRREPIQRTLKLGFPSDRKWVDVVDPSWNWVDCDFRVKPKPREVFIAEYESGLSVSYNSLEHCRACHKAIRILRFVEAGEVDP